MPSVVTFTSQDSRLCVSLNIVDDVVVESAENFFVVASSQDSRLFISGSSSVSVVISDNDECKCGSVCTYVYAAENEQYSSASGLI